MKTAVIILNYNGIELLKQFLPGVIQYSAEAEIVVADNGSKDGSAQWLLDEMPQVTLLPFNENYGFAEGYNRAIDAVTADYVVLLNSDVEVTQGWLQPLIACLQSSDKIAACMPKIRSQRNKELFEYAGAAGGYIDSYGYPFCRGRILEHVEEDHGQYDSAKAVFWSTGAALCIKKTLYQQVGGLDGKFFAHMEEIDLCWRLNARGFDQYCIPESVVYHIGGATLESEHPRKTYLNFRNNAIMLYKNMPNSYLYWVSFVRFWLDLMAALHLLIQGKPKNAIQVVKARCDYWRMKKEFKKQRKENLRLSVRKNLSGMYPGLLLWQVYVKQAKLFSKLPKF